MNRNKRVSGVEADTYDVNFSRVGHWAGPNVKEVVRDAKRNEVGTGFCYPTNGALSNMIFLSIIPCPRPLMGRRSRGPSLR
jgi:hypothetical protein